MNLYLSDKLFTEESTTICGMTFSCDFTTSADVVMKACGLRLEAIRVIAREQGVEIDDPACSNIDLSLLAALADAHIRRLRAYYRNARRHAAQLGGDELTTFVDFCKTYKKRQVETVCSWDDIDIDAIKERFYRKVQELTPRKKGIFESLFSEWSELFCIPVEIELEDARPIVNRLGIHQEVIDPFSYHPRYWSLDDIWQKDDVIERVVISDYYRHGLKQVYFNVDKRAQIRKVTLSARFHIFIDEDEHHLNSNCDCKFNLLTGALRMIA